uniref:G-protein coupled receptors family 1 profile domain-containing protein n=1 Tax=Gopherus agassizii TaxID=38772 RepID=A0A452GHV2_9SAUR
APPLHRPRTGELGNATAPGAAPGYNFAALVFGVSLILCVLGGNLLVCLSVCSERALKTTTNYFIVSLAVADLLLALLVLPLYVYSEVSQALQQGPLRAQSPAPLACAPWVLPRRLAPPLGPWVCNCCIPSPSPASAARLCLALLTLLWLELRPHCRMTGLGAQSQLECGMIPLEAGG